MRKNVSNDVLCRRYVEGIFFGKNKQGNMFIEDNILWSYGRHFPLAVWVGETLFLNKQYYSPTTSNQQSDISMASNRYMTYGQCVSLDFKALGLNASYIGDQLKILITTDVHNKLYVNGGALSYFSRDLPENAYLYTDQTLAVVKGDRNRNAVLLWDGTVFNTGREAHNAVVEDLLKSIVVKPVGECGYELTLPYPLTDTGKYATKDKTPDLHIGFTKTLSFPFAELVIEAEKGSIVGGKLFTAGNVFISTGLSSLVNTSKRVKIWEIHESNSGALKWLLG